MEGIDDGDVDTMLAVNVADKLYQIGNQAKSDYRPAKPAEFARFMRRHADRALGELGALGFSSLGDYYPAHVAAVLSEKTLLRCYRAADASISAASYAVRPGWPGWIAWLQLRLSGQYPVVAMMELESMFDDGFFIATANGGTVDPFGYGPGIEREALPQGTSAADLFRRHCERRDEYLQRHPGVRVVPTLDMPAVIAMQDRFTEIRNVYRQSIGYVTDAELQQLLGERQDLAGKVREQLAAISEPTDLPPDSGQPFQVIAATPDVDGALSLRQLIDLGLEQGLAQVQAQVQAVGSPLHPFCLDESGKAYFLFNQDGGADPMAMALPAIRAHTPDIRRCALVVDSRLTLADGCKRDAIVVMACERDGGRRNLGAALCAETLVAQVPSGCRAGMRR